MKLVLMAAIALASFHTIAWAQEGGGGVSGDKIKVLIVDGQNNHNWQQTTPLLREMLEKSGRFTVDVATTPPARPRGRGRGIGGGENAAGAAVADMSTFHPKFSDYQVVVSNYNGDAGRATRRRRLRNSWRRRRIRDLSCGRQLVPRLARVQRNVRPGRLGWTPHNPGPLVYVSDTGDVKTDTSTPGNAGHHGQQHEFKVTLRDSEHPITKGLPPVWMHTRNEMYDTLRGPAEKMHVLATAYSAPDTGGTGRNERC